MVEYIGVSDVSRFVTSLGLGPFLERLAAMMEADYRRWDEFEKSARVASHSAVGVIELMPTSDAQFYAFKYVNGHPKNTARGLLTVTAFGLLADVVTGYPLLLSELTITTALRTAAMSALAARWLARPDSRSMALVGNGSQSEFQAVAFHRLVGIRTLRLYDIDPLATAKLVHNLQAMPDLNDLEIVRCASAAHACQGADIVTTITADKKNGVILTPPMIRPGMHLNAVGGDCPGKTELHVDVLGMPNLETFVEFAPQTRAEGEIQQMPPDFPVTQFADVVRSAEPLQRRPETITLFDSVGFALEDYSALRFLYALVQEQRVGRHIIDLIPTLLDPKDLYGGTIGASRSRLRRAS
jgi:ornithine cyclodeaminase